MTPLVEAATLGKSFPGRGLLQRTWPVQAVRDVSLPLAPGEAFGVVDESGSGKSTLGRLLLGLLPATTGTARFAGARLDQACPAEFHALRARMQIVFQDPFGSLDARRRIARILLPGEPPNPADRPAASSSAPAAPMPGPPAPGGCRHWNSRPMAAASPASGWPESADGGRRAGPCRHDAAAWLRCRMVTHHGDHGVQGLT